MVGIRLKNARKAARQRLKDATLAEYNELILAANLTPIQSKILDMHIQQESSISKIAIELFCSDSTVRKHLARAYDKVSKA